MRKFMHLLTAFALTGCASLPRVAAAPSAQPVRSAADRPALGMADCQDPRTAETICTHLGPRTSPQSASTADDNRSPAD